MDTGVWRALVWRLGVWRAGAWAGMDTDITVIVSPGGDLVTNVLVHNPYVRTPRAF